ncbi:helix-turn-helix domain-containing protein [Enterococcus sp. AZ109]|uniref:helix-turn-helix domain-containing protein n=1 Tax=Enterococcus sp. AZ109 TaxID=2774634 RepID=UPI003F223F97
MYGEVMKQIRKAKGYTQKEVYTGVVSKTFYSDFEAGKYSVEITKFQGLLKNLGISYKEFMYFKETLDEGKRLEDQIDRLYKKGKFEELYEIYQQYHQHAKVELRYSAIRAYLLVLLTNPNFYQFSRTPFLEILADLENAKMWMLKEIKLSKLVLLSLTESDKKRADELFQRILQELEKYHSFDPKVYYEEVGDLFFNRLQSLLIINDISQAETALAQYQELVTPSDDLLLMIQLQFITYLVDLYSNFPEVQSQLQLFLEQLTAIPTSETHFYQIIFQIHQEKARNYYQRYIEK